MPTVRDLQAMAGEEPITMLTAYDAVTASIVDDTGVDVILVGDSMGNAVLGHDDTLPVTLDEMASRVGAVARGADDALVVADMPFLSFGTDESESIQNCGQMLKEEGANAVKLESGPHTVELTERLTELGIPTMAHLGLTPQSVNQTGYTRQATGREEAEEILDLAREHEAAGAFALVLEHIPANLAAQVTEPSTSRLSASEPAATVTGKCSCSPMWSASPSPARLSPSSSATFAAKSPTLSTSTSTPSNPASSRLSPTATPRANSTTCTDAFHAYSAVR